jgi:hypothetical protein
MKTNPKPPRRKKKPEPVVEIDENIFNPFAPVLTLFRRRSNRERTKKPRSFRHDFALVLLLHVIAILAFVAHGSIKRYNATQKQAPVSAKKQEKKSAVEEIVKSSPGSAPELIETENATRPGQHALRAVHEADPFLPEKLTKSEPPAPQAPKSMAEKNTKKEPPKQTAKSVPRATKTPPVVQSPAVAKQSKSSDPAPSPAPTADDANTRRAFLEATGRIERRPEPPQIQNAAEPQIRRAEPVVRPVQSATRPPSPEIRPAMQPTSLPSSAVAWSTQPVNESAMRTAAEAPRNQTVRASEYTVGPGDNLELISKRLGVGYEQLAALNNLSSSRDLRIGRKLAVPEDTGSF